jgi:hypothetical protein
VIADGSVDEDVVITGWDGDLEARGDGSRPCWVFVEDVGGGEGEVPNPIEGDDLATWCVLRFEHDGRM